MGDLLSPEFLSNPKYSQRPKHAGILFDVIRRKYGHEPWRDLCKRVVNYSLGLYQGSASEQELKTEAELMFDLMYDCVSFPAGRTMRIGGTKAAELHPESNFNCSALIMRGLEDFCDLFHLSMCSCGVGYRILFEDVVTIPQFNTSVSVVHDGEFVDGDGKKVFKYNCLYPYAKNDNTELSYNGWQGSTQLYTITVGDSKQGWVDALRKYLELSSSTHNPVQIRFNYDYVRPEGSPLKTWGGYSAGPDGLVKMFDFITKIIKNSAGKLRPIHVMDICDYIGATVVVGGSRRAALIALFSPDDEECLNAKYGDALGCWVDKHGNKSEYEDSRFKNKEISWKASDISHRTMSNNTIVFKEKPSYEKLKSIFERIRYNGEPGFFNLEAASKRRPNADLLNPCSEILLANYGVCNLTTNNMMAFIKDGEVDWELLNKAVRNATRIGLRMTNVTLSLPHWDEVQKRDRLLGVSKTGEMDFLDKMQWKRNSKEHINLLKFMRAAANNEADAYAYEMGVNRPLLVTTCKPEGSLTQLPTVSSGVHRAWAPYYIRNIKFADFDPMCKALKELGVPWEEDKTKPDSNRIVFRFPIKTDAEIEAYDEPFRDQFFGYINSQDHYADHNTSCSLYVGDDEWQEALDLVYEHWDKIIAVSFLPKVKGRYPQAPYEQCTKEEYEELLKRFPKSLDALDELVAFYDIVNSTMEDSPDCSSGACPPV